MGLSANPILQGFLLLEQRKRQARADRQAEEQQKIKNLQAQKEQSLREKEQKRRQKVTDLNSQVLERKFALDTAVEKLQFEEGQALGRTPSVPSAKFEEDFRALGGLSGPGTVDTSGLAGPFGAPSFQPEERQAELIQAFRVNQQLQEQQQLQKSLASPTVLAGQQRGLFRAELAENARLNQIDRDKKLQEGKIEIQKLKGRNRLDAIERRGQLRKQEKAIEGRFGGPRVIRGVAASALYGNSNLTGSEKFKAAVRKVIQELGTELAIEMGFDPEEAAEVSYQDIPTAKKKDITSLAPILTTLDEMHDLLMEGIEKGWFPDTLVEASLKKALEEGKDLFGVSEFTIRLESLLGRAATVARSVGEVRFTEGDIARAIFLMTRPGLKASEASRRFNTMRDATNFVYDLKTRGIHPFQQAIIVGPQFMNMLQGRTKSERTLEADPSIGGPDEEARIMPDGKLFWWNPKTGKRRDRVK